MNLSQRVVMFPLTEVWDEQQIISKRKIGAVGAWEIVELLRAQPVQFVVADVGRQLRWVTPSECFAFWKTEVKLRLIEPGATVRLDDLPNQYGYTASQWEAAGLPVVVLERCH